MFPGAPLRIRILGLLVLVLAGCSTMGVVPDSRDSDPDLAADWNRWGAKHLQNGDIVFMRGDCYLMMGTVNFSEVSTEIAASRFSHIGLVAIEHGEPYVYDFRSEGCLRTRFGELLAHRQLHQVAIKRHTRVDHASREQVSAFCRSLYEQHPPYDSDLKLDNDRLYCTELVQEAYRRVGQTLSEPIRIRDLPNYARHQRTIQWVTALTRIEADQAVLIPGNDQMGIWANRDLQLVLDLPDTKVRPATVSSRRF